MAWRIAGFVAIFHHLSEHFQGKGDNDGLSTVVGDIHLRQAEEMGNACIINGRSHEKTIAWLSCSNFQLAEVSAHRFTFHLKRYISCLVCTRATI